MSDETICRTCLGTGEVISLDDFDYDGFNRASYQASYVDCPCCKGGLRGLSAKPVVESVPGAYEKAIDACLRYIKARS